MHSIGDFFLSFWIFFKVKWFLYKEKKEVIRKFPNFLPFECALNRAYRLHNPFRICKEHLKQQGEKFTDAYGETPLPVLAKIASECALNANDVLFELGCGRGRGALFLSQLIGCRVVGIDWVPFFILTAQNIVKSMDPKMPITFRCSAMQTASLAGATAIFLYGTGLSDKIIEALLLHFEKLPSITKIITVSYPLSDYSSQFHILKQFSASFPWGEGEIFINSLRKR